MTRQKAVLHTMYFFLAKSLTLMSSHTDLQFYPLY